MNPPEQYDYIITGAGLAGLSLVMHIINSEKLKHKKILIIDKLEKNVNDRTWCFWEKDEGLFQDIVFKQWKTLKVYNNDFEKELNIAPYQYKLIRGIDLYTYCLQKIKDHTNITFLNAGVETIDNEKNIVTADGKKYSAQYIFNSIYEKPSLKKNEYWLLQHFKGWFINTGKPSFNSAVGTLMDFRTDQQYGTTFFYVLPFSPTEALIEYTLFSPHLLNEEAYEYALQQYIQQQLGIEEYTVQHKEFGVIPMTNHIFKTHENGVINIGTAGGQTKGSSGYTFQFVQKHSAAIVKCLEYHKPPVVKSKKRFHFYDSVLLTILYNRTLPGDKIFTQLFKKNKASKVFSFLDNESSLADDISIISTLPTLPFTKAAMQQMI